MMKYLKRLSKWRNSSGFTLVEVVVSTALLGVLIVGILLFMTPVFGMIDNNEVNQKADRTATTMELYLSKSLRSSLFVKVFTGATLDDINDSSGAIYTDEQFKAMKQFATDNSANYELRCISIKYVEDTNPRNNSTSNNPHKYMMFNEKVDTSYYMLDTTKTELVFDNCFYEDIYPKFTFRRNPVCFDKDGNVIAETYDEDGNVIPKHEDENGVKADPWPHDASTNYTMTLYPVLEMDIDIYGDESMDISSRAFFGKSYIEVNNVKSLQLNSKGTYVIHEPEAITDGSTNKDIYIFYVARKTGVAVGSTSSATSSTSSSVASS